MRLTIVIAAALVLGAGATPLAAKTAAKPAFQLNETTWTFVEGISSVVSARFRGWAGSVPLSDRKWPYLAESVRWFGIAAIFVMRRCMSLQLKENGANLFT